MINIFSFFSGAGFQDLGFELQGNYDILFVNEYHKSFNRIQVSQVKELAKLEYLLSLQNSAFQTLYIQSVC